MAQTLPDLSRLSRLLIIRLSSIGDVVHALPVASALARSFPNLQITWIVEEMSAGMVVGNPCLADVIVIPRSRWKSGRSRSPAVWREYLRFLSDLRRRRFEVVLDLQGYGKSALIALATAAPNRFGWRRLRDGSQLVSRRLPARSSSLHRTDMFLDTVRALGADVTAPEFPVEIPEAARTEVEELLCRVGIAPGSRYVALNPGAGSRTRCWPPDRYAELAARLELEFGLQTVLTGSARDATLCDHLSRRAETILQELRGAPHRNSVVSLAGATDLKRLSALLAGACLHVAGDTGSTHIAAALGTPVIGIYGPTDPLHAGPYGQLDRVLACRELCLRECGVRRCARIPEGSETSVPPCLEAVTVEDVVRQAAKVLNGRP